MVTRPRPARASAVALLADMPGTGQFGPAAAHRFSLRGRHAGERFGGFLDFAARQLDEGRKVVALYPSWRAEPALRAVRFARGGLRTDHIAAVGLPLAPLPLSVVADQLAYLAPFLAPGLVPALSAELPRRMLAGAWLRSVGGLAHPSATLRQHLASHVPGTAFLACCAPTPQIRRIRGSDGDLLPYLPDAPVALLTSAPDATATGPFDQAVAAHLGAVRSGAVPAQPLGRAYWRSADYVEFAAFSAHPGALTRAVDAVRAGVCTWCREPVAAERCPFCGAPARGTPAPGAASPAADSAVPPPRPPSVPPADGLRAVDPPVADPDPSAVPRPRAAPFGPPPPAALPMAPNGRRGAHPLTAPADPRPRAAPPVP
ncbi:hypothetical protein [Nocardiopsis trehalosi]|uniref:hypothetical protein n=1 Tax=Nocardiopsis trehalosi TaxID=109329 RepID=UPI0008321C0C|nr:hypothetical protein [Nocardiopsis trehalosi]